MAAGSYREEAADEWFVDLISDAVAASRLRSGRCGNTVSPELRAYQAERFSERVDDVLNLRAASWE